MPASQRANLARVKVIIREVDEMCMAAAKLRRRIQRDMRAIKAREELGFRDDQAVTDARKPQKA
jgi:ParB-like chromosome segregation protein Spo0J